MCEFNILYDEKCLIWDTDKILMFEVLPKSTSIAQKNTFVISQENSSKSLCLGY